MRFADFLTFDAAATALYDDPNGQRRCRACLTKLAETARRHPGKFLAEAARKDVRRGVAFRSKPLDDLETAVFAQRLADRLPAKPAGGNYGDFLRHSVRSQGDVLGDMNWDTWEITKAAMELGGVDPNDLTDPKKSPAERLALVNQINWQNVTVPRLKAKLGPSFRVDDAWKRQFGIERLQRIKAAVEQGQPITDPQDRKLLGIWRTLEVQFGREILPAGPESDVGMTRLPMSRADRRRFYHALTGTNESVETPLRLSAESAYDYLARYGVEAVTDEEAKDLYLARILQDLRNRTAFIPSFARGTEADRKRWRDSASRSWGGFLPAARFYDPGSAPGFAQRLSGMTTRGFKMRTNPSGRRVPYAYGAPEEFAWPGGSEDMPGIKYSVDVLSQEVPDEKINTFYRSRTPEANAAVQRELVAPSAAVAAEGQVVGWRGNGSGCYPTANPPTQWGRTSTGLKQIRYQAAKPKGDASSGRSLADGVIRQWLVLGPVAVSAEAKADTAKFEMIKGEADLAPDAGDKVGKAAWKTADSEDEMLDFASLWGKKTDVVAYAAVYLWSPADQT
ncbi:MAG: hypothetical protein ABSF26_31045, partial [Thermoguttaceae bacterium]